MISAMNTEKTAVNDEVLEALLYLSRLSPSATDLNTLKKQVDQIVEYFGILSEFDYS